MGVPCMSWIPQTSSIPACVSQQAGRSGSSSAGSRDPLTITLGLRAASIRYAADEPCSPWTVLHTLQSRARTNPFPFSWQLSTKSHREKTADASFRRSVYSTLLLPSVVRFGWNEANKREKNIYIPAWNNSCWNKTKIKLVEGKTQSN